MKGKYKYIICLFILFILQISTQVSGAEKILKTVFVKKIIPEELAADLIYPTEIGSKINATILSESAGIITILKGEIGRTIKMGETLATITQNDPLYQFKPIHVKASVSGVINGVQVSSGQMVSKGERLFTIIDPKQIAMKIEVPIADLSLLKRGMVGSLQLNKDSNDSNDNNDNKNKFIPVTIQGINPTVDPATGTATVELKLQSNSRLPQLGSLLFVKFKASMRSAILVNEELVTYHGKNCYLKTLDSKNRVKKVEIKLGERYQGKIEILSGLKKDDLIVERSSGVISEGDEVIVSSKEQSK